MDGDQYFNIFHYCVSQKRPEELEGTKNKNKWKSFKKQCNQMYSIIFPKDAKEKTMEIGILFRKCWSPKLKRNLQKIVVQKKDFPKIWTHFHLSSETGVHRGIIFKIYY